MEKQIVLETLEDFKKIRENLENLKEVLIRHYDIYSLVERTVNIRYVYQGNGVFKEIVSREEPTLVELAWVEHNVANVLAQKMENKKADVILFLKQ